MFVQGFQVLVEREWLEFGHKFADRCALGIYTEDTNERCPIFLQFLDCMHQLIKQFPCAFQFNEAFLVRCYLPYVISLIVETNKFKYMHNICVV